MELSSEQLTYESSSLLSDERGGGDERASRPPRSGPLSAPLSAPSPSSSQKKSLLGMLLTGGKVDVGKGFGLFD
jgi:hypothetical protein